MPDAADMSPRDQPKSSTRGSTNTPNEPWSARLAILSMHAANGTTQA